MAGTDPYQDALERPRPSGSLEERYSPLRRGGQDAPPPQLPNIDPEFTSFIEALRLQAEDFNIPDLPDAPPAAEPDSDYEPPTTVDEARKALDVAETNLNGYRAQLDAFAEETRGMVPLSHEQSQEIIRRANVIARSRRDLAKNSEALSFARTQLEQEGAAAAEDPTFWESALDVGGKAIGGIGDLIANSPLAGVVETLGGIGSYGAQTLAKLTGEGRIGASSYGYSFKDYAQDMNPLNVAFSALGIGSTQSDLRKRGREFFSEAGKSLSTFEKQVILTTPVWREFHEWNPVALTLRRPVLSALEGVQIGGRALGGAPFESLSPAEQERTRDQFYEIGLQVAMDPLNVVDFGAPLTKLGKLRAAARVNAGTLETGALVKSLREVPEIGATLGKDAFKIAEGGELVTSLREAGLAGDKAESLAKRFDLARNGNLKDLRELASTDPQAWGTYMRALLQDAPGKGTVRRAEQYKALDRMAEFGDDIDPIIGRTYREQAALGQRLKVTQRLLDKYGDRWWIKMPEKAWAKLTGQSLLADIADNPVALDSYFANRMFKADAGAEILRFQQDTAGKLADMLNAFNEAERAQLMEQLPRTVEHMNKEGRAALRAGLDAGSPLKTALLDLADFYDESAETLKAIQNRFGVNVADLGGELGYFGRQFSPELQQWLLSHPTAREWLFGAKVKQSKAAMSTALLPEERGRKLRDLDFAESENFLRKSFREYGLPDNIKIWDRDAFGLLAERAKKTLHTAERRNLYANFLEAHAGQVDAVTHQENLDDILALAEGRIAGAHAKAGKKLADAEAELQAALAAQAEFRAGRASIRTGARQAGKAPGPLGASVDALGGVRNQAGEVDFAAKAGAEMGRGFPSEGEDVLRRFADEARARLKAMEKRGGFASDVVNRAQRASDQYVADIQRVQDKWWADNPGAMWPRDADEYARQVLPQYRAIVKRFAKDLEAIAPKSLIKEFERLHGNAVRQLDAFEGAQRAVAEGVAESVNKRVRNAQSAHKAAKKGAEEVGLTKGNVQEQAAKARGAAQDAKSAAEAAQGAAGREEGYYAEVQAEMRAAERRYREKVADYQAKGGEYAKAAAAQKKAKEDYFKAQGGKVEGWTPEENAAMRDATLRMKQAAEALKKAKGARASAEDIARLEGEMRSAQDAVKAAEAKAQAAKPRAAEARALADKLAAESARADAALKQAERDLEAAHAALMKHHPDFWSPEEKAKWLLQNMRGNRRLAEMGPNGRQMNALQVMLDAKVKPPADWEELARYASINLTPADAEEFNKLWSGLYWRDLEPRTALGKAFDSLKAIYQRSTLARFGSLTKDLFGTSVNGIMAGNMNYWDRAMKEVGTFREWINPNFRKGAVANRLTGMGVLKTTRGEAFENIGVLEEMLPGVLGKGAGNIERHGVIGGTLKSIGAPTTGKGVGKVFHSINEGRQYWEEVNRVATYLKAIDEGKSGAEAINDVYKWWGKFDELSKLDRTVLNRVLFFWTWMARSVPITIAHLFEHPVRSKWLLAMMAGDADQDGKAPNWLKRMGAWALGSSHDGSVRSVALGGSTYFSPTFAMLQGNFADQMMHGKPLEAVSGALKDLARATPPFIQAIPELALRHDMFTDKPWWKDKNAQAGSNAKAPSVLWWFYAEPDKKGGLSALSDLLGLKPVTGPDGNAQYLTMDPAWSWFFGALPGLEPALSDVGAFFRPPQGELEGAAPRPELDLVKGAARTAGFPIYDVPMDGAKSQTFEFRKALGKSADGLSGGALMVTDTGRIAPSKTTWRGQKMRADMDSWEAQAKASGMGARQAHEAAMDKMRVAYQSEWRLLSLQDRLDAWTEYLVRMEQGGEELSEQVKADVEMMARRADYNRVQRYQDKAADALLPKEYRR